MTTKRQAFRSYRCRLVAGTCPLQDTGLRVNLPKVRWVAAVDPAPPSEAWRRLLMRVEVLIEAARVRRAKDMVSRRTENEAVRAPAKSMLRLNGSRGTTVGSQPTADSSLYPKRPTTNGC